MWRYLGAETLLFVLEEAGRCGLWIYGRVGDVNANGMREMRSLPVSVVWWRCCWWCFGRLGGRYTFILVVDLGDEMRYDRSLS